MKKSFILFDTEFTCWEGSMERNWNYENEFREIIQWSALKVNEKLEVIDEFSYYVKPNINLELSDYCKNLTGIKQSDVDNAKNFKEIFEEFKHFSNNGNINKWSWGNDVDVIIENCDLTNTQMKYTNKYHDLRDIFNKEKIDFGTSTSGELSSFFGINSKGHVHNSDFDTLSLYLSVKKFEDKISKHLF